MAWPINSELIKELRAWFIGRNDPIVRRAGVIGHREALDGLAGFWPFASRGITGNLYDASGQGRTLTRNGGPLFSRINQTAFCDFSASTQFFARADEADLDIIGSEAHNVSGIRGVTIMIWCRPDTNANTGFVAGKKGTGGSAGNPAYALIQNSTNTLLFRVRNAADAANFDVTQALTIGAWNFFAGRYIPSTEITCWVGNNASGLVEATPNTTSIPASLLNSNGDFQLSGAVGATHFDGGLSLCSLYQTALPDADIIATFEEERLLFGV